MPTWITNRSIHPVRWYLSRVGFAACFPATGSMLPPCLQALHTVVNIEVNFRQHLVLDDAHHTESWWPIVCSCCIPRLPHAHQQHSALNFNSICALCVPVFPLHFHRTESDIGITQRLIGKRGSCVANGFDLASSGPFCVLLINVVWALDLTSAFNGYMHACVNLRFDASLRDAFARGLLQIRVIKASTFVGVRQWQATQASLSTGSREISRP